MCFLGAPAHARKADTAMRYRSLMPGALALSMAWVTACGDDATEPTQSATPTPSGPELAVVSNSWITRKNLPFPRTSLAVATVRNAAGQSIVYAIGGTSDVYPGTFLRNVTAYNVATNTWTERRPLPVPLGATNGAGVINGKIYISGGLTVVGDAPPTRALYVYDPGTNSWTRKHDLPAINSPGKDWTVGLNGVTGVIDNRLYVVTFCSMRLYNSGCEGDLTGPRLFRYNPVTDQWVKLAAPFPAKTADDQQVFTLAGGVIGGKFYVMAGDLLRTAGGIVRRGRLSAYDPATNRWTAKKPLGLAREGVATAVLGNKLYVMGGERLDTVRYVFEQLDVTIVYDPVTNLWTRRASMPSPRVNMAGATVLLNGKPRIEVLGGFGGGSSDNLQYIP
jgi:N-acetylneuraminic acid mutarotase